MHEMSLAQSIVEIVENTAQQNQAPSVVSVKLIVGELAGVEMHALMQGLKIASQGTVMQDAKIAQLAAHQITKTIITLLVVAVARSSYIRT